MKMIANPQHAGHAQADDRASLERLFGTSDDLLPLWIAEPYLPIATPVVRAMEARAHAGWYGYEIRPEAVNRSFTSWMRHRHGWDLTGAQLLISPSLGTSIGVALDLLTDRGDGVILQPPVFTDFKPLVTRSHRKVVRNSLVLDDDGYRMDIEGLAEVASDPDVKAMILCNPHNPVGRVWTMEELTTVAEICAHNDVFVISDEIHADILLNDSRFTPFGVAARSTDIRWRSRYADCHRRPRVRHCVQGDELPAASDTQQRLRSHRYRDGI
jgi:bifunctional pyridoxal-dependent enzyme with beta-cystathionase and maltose regulon repressor activities